MEPIHFEGVNTQMGKGQPQYNVLPVQMVEITPAEECPLCDGHGIIPDQNTGYVYDCGNCNGTGKLSLPWNEYTCRYKLSEMEIAQIIKTKSFFFIQSGFGFNPIFPAVENIKSVILIDYLITDGIVEAWIPMADKTEVHTVAPDPLSMVELICSAYELLPENLGFRERKTLGVNEQGEIETL
jgi:hypothetical protein